MQRAADNIVLQAGAEVATAGMLSFEMRAGLAPIEFSKSIAMSDARGNIGPSLFQRVEMSQMGTEVKIGAELPLRICVEECDGPREDQKALIFSGQVYVTLGATSQLINGELKMDGWWMEVFKVPFVHIGDGILNVGWDMKMGQFFWIPVAMKLGGKVCFGSKTACERRRPGTDNFIMGMAYAGMHATKPEENFFIGGVTDMTFSKIFKILVRRYRANLMTGTT